MSKFHVDLCLPPTDPKQLPEAIATALAPFRVDQPGDWSEDWIWDWWHINSYEDSGDFAVRAEHDGDPRLIWEPTFPNLDLRERAPLRCDGGPRGLLDPHLFLYFRVSARTNGTADQLSSGLDFL